MSFDLERIRDYVEGRLPQAEREAFAEEIRRDAALAELVETYELVVRATADAAPAATTSFGDVMLRARAARRAPWGAIVAAAAVLLLAAGVWQLLKGPVPVRLTAIPLALRPAPEAPPEWPRELVEHETSDEAGLLWYEDMGTALAVARAGHAPVFLFIHHPGCQWCNDFRDDQCRDQALIRAADGFVLLSLEWQDAPKELQRQPRDGWPIFDLLDEQGKRIDGFTGIEPAATVAAWLEKRERSPRPDWQGLRGQAKLLEEAEASDDPAARLALYRQVAAARNVLGTAARAHIAAMEKVAQDALFAARESCSRLGAAAAADRLDEAARAVRGTPYAKDLETVVAYLRERGSFPELKE